MKVAGLRPGRENLFELSKKVGTVLQDSDGQFIGLTVGEDIAFSLENDCVEEEGDEGDRPRRWRTWWIWKTS